MPFDHPLWVLYSSGTTGLPKAIVQGHGGILLEHLKSLRLHSDLGPGDRFLWFTTTGWMMWNFLVGGLLVGRRSCCTTAAPATPTSMRCGGWPSGSGHHVRTSAPYLQACLKARLEPGATSTTSARSDVGSTGAPLSADGLPSGSTTCRRPCCRSRPSPAAPTSAPRSSAAAPTVPVWLGGDLVRALGAKVEAFDAAGRAAARRGRRAGDHRADAVDAGVPSGATPTGAACVTSYFGDYPGVWRHGDWIRHHPARLVRRSRAGRTPP